ncbi:MULTISPECIES: hypothetical protein [Streptomyces]|uniref:Uncharacterized protein n=1 Tax=Streptomyces malaysiensis TaxID=92644 RepID=A0A2J7YZU2_STRMQ|nr:MULTISPECIES: hypothetical protein [Streptomyces]MCC4320222.1 hypothetical protein [Streptomyces malaysiensis]MCD9591459.1 hypothetical protein [Streptomyces sp. 8ZJF_21]MCM3811059.1 hypothetical protein [Streptomyces sp. DR7-3]PNG93531.1 hypothetical protein SMF913_28996 [Streptomyces malaysiensis]
MSGAHAISGTRAFLVRRLIALLVVTAVAVTTLLAAYYGVSRNSRAVTDRSTPAILQVAAAIDALTASYDEARRSIASPTAEFEGLSEEYRDKLSTARQSLAQVSKSTIGGESARGSLRTCAALVTSYGDTVEQAYANRDNPTLRGAYLGYAGSILRHGHSGILDRLRAVQDRQFDVLDDQTSFGWLLSFAWWLLVPGLFLTLAALLVHTQRFLRHRFRRLVNPWLAAATALLVALLPLAVFTYQTQDRLESARASLTRSDIGRTGGPTAREVARTMRNAHWQAGAVGWIPVGGAVLAVLILVGLQPRIDEYRFQPR